VESWVSVFSTPEQASAAWRAVDDAVTPEEGTPFDVTALPEASGVAPGTDGWGDTRVAFTHGSVLATVIVTDVFDDVDHRAELAALAVAFDARLTAILGPA
jgi:hypothetical protein